MLKSSLVKLIRKFDKRRGYEMIYAFEESHAFSNWEVGGPQPEMARLADRGEIKGTILEVGCGTGENGLYLAALGHEVWGIDFASSAIEKAKAKARERGLKVNFMVGDVLNLQSIGRTFDSVIDVGLFHSLDPVHRQLFVPSLRSALKPGGTYHLLCISDREPAQGNHVSHEEIMTSFNGGEWNINYIHEARLKTVNEKNGKLGWLASISRL